MFNAEKFWDKSAEKYAKSPVSDENTYRRKLSETQRHLMPDSHVVEFGCGTGSTAIHHAPHVRRIDALDISNNMLEIGRTKAREAGITNIDFVHATLHEFAADSDSIDVVLGLNVMHLIADRREVLQEIVRILKPGGVFVSSTGCLGNSKWRFVALLAPLLKLLRLMPDIYVLTQEQWLDELDAAGFKIEHHWQGGLAVFVIATKSPQLNSAQT